MAPIDMRDVGMHGRGMALVYITISFSILALFLVSMRLVTRLSAKCTLGMDDYAIALSMFFSICLTVATCISVDHGYGKRGGSLSEHDLRAALQAFWAIQILYKFTINLTKTSILVLYLRIFPNIFFRRYVYTMLFLVLGYATSSVIATIFECTPISRIFDKSIPGSCINLTQFWYANAITNIIGDCIIFFSPMPLIRTLKLPLRQRLGLALVFALGCFVCVTSVLRITTLKTSSTTIDQTYGTLVSTTWTTVEANLGIMCACLPTMKAPLARLFPRLLGGSTQLSGSAAARERPAADPQNHPPSDSNPWGRKIRSSRRSPLRARGSSDEIFGLASITKTTSIRVEFGQDMESESSGTIGKDSMTIPPSSGFDHTLSTGQGYS